MSKKQQTIKKPAHVILDDDDVPSIPRRKAGKSGPTTTARDRLVRKVARAHQQLTRVSRMTGLKMGNILASVEELHVSVASLPADWRPTGAAAGRTPRATLAPNALVSLKPKFVAAFRDAVDYADDLKKLTVVKVLADAKKLVVRTPHDEKLIVGANMVVLAA